MVIDERLSDDSVAVVLLNLALESDEDEIKVLNDDEFLQVEGILKANSLSFSSLFDTDILQAVATNLELDFDRLRSLLSRDFELQYELDNLNQQGIWLLTYLDNEYPKILKKKMRSHAPKLLFGSGPIEYLSRGGLALLGSQSANKVALQFAESLSMRCAKENLMLITGGSKGAESLVLETVLKNGGNAVAVVPDTLLSRCYTDLLSDAIREGRLTVISPFHPRSGFASNKLKDRNSIIFTLCDYAVIIASDLNRGGTFSGTVTELKRRKPLPIFAYVSNPESAGNRALIEMGAKEWPQFEENKLLLPQIKAFINEKSGKVEYEQVELF